MSSVTVLVVGAIFLYLLLTDRLSRMVLALKGISLESFPATSGTASSATMTQPTPAFTV